MNLALFLTDRNKDDVAAFVNETSELQRTNVNGALTVIHSNSINNAFVDELISPIKPLFKVVTSIPCNVGGALSNDSLIASLFGRFLLNGYAKFPGPWLIVDEKALPTKIDFMQECLKLHQLNGGIMTGRAVRGNGWLVPVGPVVLSAPAQGLKFLRFFSGEGWRRRGQYHFSRIGFGSIPIEEYCFSITEKTIEPPALQRAPKPTPIARDAIRKPFIPVNDDVTSPTIPNPLVVKEETDYSSLDDASLRQLASDKIGKKVHHFTKRENVLAMLVS